MAAGARRVFYQLSLVHQLQPCLSQGNLATATHSLLTSRLDYCNVFNVGLLWEM